MPKAVTMKQVQDAIGKDATDTLWRYFAGMQIYFGKKQEMSYVDLNCRNQSIRNDYYLHKLSNKDLQKKYNLGRSQIHVIVNQKQDAK